MSPIRGDDGRIVGASKIGRDITEAMPYRAIHVLAAGRPRVATTLPPREQRKRIRCTIRRMSDAPRVTVTRTAPNDVKVRQVVLSLDGEPLATLFYGDSVTREIASGDHYLRAHNTLVWKTLDFTAAPGEHLHFRVVNRPGPGTYAMLSLLGTGPIYLTLERVHE